MLRTMAENTQINHLLHQIAMLDFESKVELIEKAVRMLAEQNSAAGSGESNLSKLRGLGSEIWKQTDTDAYLRKEREAWD